MLRSRRFTGDLGEWYVERLYGATRTQSQTQKGWDLLDDRGQRLQVKAQSYDPTNAWNYLDTPAELFDRLVVVVLNADFTLRDLYDVPADALPGALRLGTERRPSYHFRDLTPWRIDARTLPGAPALLGLVQARVA